jgi:hypothetical protein
MTLGKVYPVNRAILTVWWVPEDTGSGKESVMEKPPGQIVSLTDRKLVSCSGLSMSALTYGFQPLYPPLLAINELGQVPWFEALTEWLCSRKFGISFFVNWKLFNLVFLKKFDFEEVWR